MAEGCSLHAGSADCDRRQPSEVTSALFPGVDFSEVSH